MFGLSFAEMAIILLVAVVVVGPKELPTVVRAVIRTVAQLRELGSEFRRNFEELAQEAKLQELHDELKNDITTAMPTIIDLEGKEQRTYDISEELEQNRQKRRLRGQAADEPQGDAPQYDDASESGAVVRGDAAGEDDVGKEWDSASNDSVAGERGVVCEGLSEDAVGGGAMAAVAEPMTAKAVSATQRREEGKGGGI